jgi:hypothetical protein
MRHTVYSSKIRRRSSNFLTIKDITMVVRRSIPKVIKPLLQSIQRTGPFKRYSAQVLKPRAPSARSSAVFRRQYSTPNNEKPTPTTKACPNCGTAVPFQSVSCTNCNSLTPLPGDINYLTLFSIPSTLPFNFDINLATLRKEYLRIMSKVHPDSMSGQPDVWLYIVTYNRNKGE